MQDLWADKREQALRAVEPLAVRMRPRTLEEFAGQHEIVGEGKLLRRMIQADTLSSVLLHGPPGTGKTTLAELIAVHTSRAFVRENAADVGVKRIREVLDEAARRLHSSGRRTILFLDEIHRFNRAQQDVLLRDVERGLITLIGATTENPIFACNSALISRSTLFRLELLNEADIFAVLERAAADKERGFGNFNIDLTEDAKRVWAKKCDGDARRALSALEVAVLSTLKTIGENETIVIDHAAAEESIQLKAAVYDATGDEHYDTISAMIKSIRGSDPDAAVYWIARMLEAGEDVRFIARRLSILASEDIGNADPRATMLASAAWQIVERIGMPEARITLAQLATYLAVAPKSNASYTAINEAMDDVRGNRTVPVPIYLRDAHAAPAADGSKHGHGYKYSHDAEDNITDQDYLGVDRTYYNPTQNGLEKQIAERLREIRELRAKLQQRNREQK
ncbi:MAG: replication-associated recombination protein A [Phycisphaeraceae bacterium]|nr:replication-associated recombination protein A [Phycisphaerales bacterium]MCB9860017.1 replication-associated recombination protein A [Phycisphaeraceae bacterium]